MKESNNRNIDQQIKDLKIKQQANKIVSRKDIELAAVIQATKDNMKNPEKSIETRTKEIVKRELRKQDKKDKQELKEAKLVANMEEKLSKWTDIDEVLSLLDDEEAKRVENRSREVQKIMNELNAKKASKVSKTSRSSTPSKTTVSSKAPVSSRQANLERKELESRRMASRKEQKQKDALAPEFNAVMEKAMQKRLDEKIEKATEEIRKKNIQTSSIAKSVAQAPVRTAVKTTTKSEEKSEKNSFMTSFINFFSKSGKSKEQDSGKVVVKNAPVQEAAANTEKTISSYKVIPGVKVYQESIDAYHTGKIKHFIDIAIGVAHNGIKNARQNFVDSLQYVANPEAARKKLEDKNANTPTFRPGIAR